RSPLKTNPRAGPLIAKPSSRAAAISFGGRILDMRNRSFAYLSARPDSSDGKQIGAASALDRWALKNRTFPSELLSAFRATAASSGLASVGWPSVRLITSGGNESGETAMDSAATSRASGTASFIGVLPPAGGSYQIGKRNVCSTRPPAPSSVTRIRCSRRIGLLATVLIGASGWSLLVPARHGFTF